MGSHYKTVCPTCRKVIAQCRCPDKNKTITVASEPCDDCKSKQQTK